MYKKIAVTNRQLCKIPLYHQIEKIAQNCKPDILILREKDLSEKAYIELAQEIIPLCEQYDITCVLHTFINAAKYLNHRKIHLPLPVVLENIEELSWFDLIGVSTHSVEEVAVAQKNGASYLTFGHVFQTDCKKGVPAKGIPLLKEICRYADIPVYAIGGMEDGRGKEAIAAGASGICQMSGYMKI